MRRLAIVAGVTALLAGAGCKPPPKEATFTEFKKQLHLYFNNLNTDAEQRRYKLASETKEFARNPMAPTPTGATFSTFSFDENGYIIFDLVCPNATCKTRYVVVDYYGTQVNCKACGAGDRGDKKLEIKPTDPLLPGKLNAQAMEELAKQKKFTFVKMFEQTQEDTKKMPVQAIVRYLRRSNSWDPRGVVEVPARALELKGLDGRHIPSTGEGAARGPGYHRVDSVFVVEQVFEFDGSEIKPIVGSGVKTGDKVVNSPTETPVRPWNEIRHIAPDQKKAN